MQYAIRQGDIPGVQLRYQIRLDLSPTELWSWLVEPDRMRQWLAGSIEPRQDGDAGWVWRGRDEGGGALAEQTRTLTVDEGRRIVSVFERTDDDWLAEVIVDI